MCILRLLERVYCEVFGDIRAQLYIEVFVGKILGEKDARGAWKAPLRVRVLPNPSDDDLKRTLAKERAESRGY